MNDQELSIEMRVLRAMRGILTRVAREAAVSPGGRSPLSRQTITDIREGLVLISAREKELNKDRGVEMTSRPKMGKKNKSSVKVMLDAGVNMNERDRDKSQ